MISENQEMVFENLKELRYLINELENIYLNINPKMPCGDKICMANHCCKNCSFYFAGYLEMSRGDKGKKMTAKIKKMYEFKKEKGFLSKTGCKLPRSLRSYTCNVQFCWRTINDHIETKNELKKICRQIEILKEILGLIY